MNVHVNHGGVGFHVYEIRRHPVLGQQFSVGVHHSLVQVRTFEISSVNEKYLCPPFLKESRGRLTIAAYLHQGGIYMNVEQLGVQLFSKRPGDAGP